MEPGKPLDRCLRTIVMPWLPDVGEVTQQLGARSSSPGSLGTTTPTGLSHWALSGWPLSFFPWDGVTGPAPQTVLVKPTCSERAQEEGVLPSSSSLL